MSCSGSDVGADDGRLSAAWPGRNIGPVRGRGEAGDEGEGEREGVRVGVVVVVVALLTLTPPHIPVTLLAPHMQY